MVAPGHGQHGIGVPGEVRVHLRADVAVLAAALLIDRLEHPRGRDDNVAHQFFGTLGGGEVLGQRGG